MTAIPVDGDPAAIQSVPVKFKAVHAADKDSGYFELYLMADLAGKQIQISERDPSYRIAILRALGAE